MSWVGGQCPVCGAIIPTFEIKATAKGLFKRKVQVMVEGDATDWIVHLWSHREEVMP